MSERLKSTNNISNEEIIDDLTKDLEFSLCTDSEEDSIRPTSGLHDFDPPDNQIEPNYSDDDTDQDPNVEGSDKEVSDTDSVDEVSLKDAEIDLTDDQKAERQTVAEELKVAGNNAFKDGEYERSVEKYTEALQICPLQFPQQRAILYCNRSAAKMKLQKYKQAVKDCTKAIELDERYVKAYYRRAQSYEVIEKLDECFADFKKVVELDPTHVQAQTAMIRLPPLIEKRNEQLKSEMFSKLKDLGNMVLKPFGLSTENFKLEQDPDSKGYKINFKQ